MNPTKDIAAVAGEYQADLPEVISREDLYALALERADVASIAAFRLVGRGAGKGMHAHDDPRTWSRVLGEERGRTRPTTNAAADTSGERTLEIERE